MELTGSSSLLALLQIIGINIILSGDNALVIAMAVRSLSPHQRKLGIWLGTGAAVVLRIVFAAAIVYLLMVPLLKLVGAMLLVWIAIKLLVPEQESEEEGVAASGSILGAVKVILIADAVMSFDNVVGIAAAAHGHFGLLALGIAISIPLVVVGAQLMVWLIDLVPGLLAAGSALLGWVAGEMAVSDPLVNAWLGHPGESVHYAVAAAGAVFVVVVGLWLARRSAQPDRAAGRG